MSSNLHITKFDIAKAKEEVSYQLQGHHEHDDCIRMAYEWLDAQKPTKTPLKRQFPLKHLIEAWAGRYVSQSDVEVAAHLHPHITGSYPFFSFSSQLVEPSIERLECIEEAMKHSPNRNRHREEDYKTSEN